MKGKIALLTAYSAILTSIIAFEFDAQGAAVETVGELKTSGGIRFNDNSLQTSACSGCAGLVPIDRGGTGADNALDARTNLGVPGLITPNYFFADQTFLLDVAISGNLNIVNTTASTGLIRSGVYTLIHTYGTSNFFAGQNAGNQSMSGANNTGIGYYSLFHDTSGNYNTAIGFEALYSNSIGTNNTATGRYALYTNGNGNQNTAIGADALKANTSGENNTAGGYRALFNNTTAARNTALGTYALYNQSYSNGESIWESNNTAIGYEALYANQPTATSNGSGNTAVGSGSLRANSYGNRNTASGVYALYRNTSGNYNTASGVSALFSNTTGNYNTATGSTSLYDNTEGDYNTAVGRNAGDANTTGSYNTFIGSNTDASANNLTNATAIGYNAEVNASNKVRIGNTSVSVVEGQVAWSNPSDSRLKKDINAINKGIEFIRELRPVEFRMKKGNERIDFGFIAQDIEALLGTDYNILGIGADTERTLSLRYTDFIAPMVKAIQEQDKIIESQKERIEILEERLARLETLINGR